MTSSSLHLIIFVRYQEHDVNDDIAECEDEIEEKCEDVTQGYTTEQQCTKWPVRKCNVAASKNKKYSPITDCKKVPFELCGPGACPVEPGPEECQQRTQTVSINYIYLPHYSIEYMMI